MKVEVLYFKGCPTYEAAVSVLAQVLEQTGIDAEVELVCVETEADGQKLQFSGSPTIRVDGRDLFPTADLGTWALGCRMYMTSEGLKGWPTPQMLKEALGVPTSS